MIEKKPKLSFNPNPIEQKEIKQEQEMEYQGSQNIGQQQQEDVIGGFIQIYITFHNRCMEKKLPEVLIFPLFQEFLKH